MIQAGTLFERLRVLGDQPLKGDFEIDEIEAIEFANEEEAHNDELQAAARQMIEGMLAMIVACAHESWGEPNFRFTQEVEDLPGWTEIIPTGFDLLVGWKRGRGKVAFALISQEDREIPINLIVGVVRGK